MRGAGIDHLDLIYPIGKMQVWQILMKFNDACKKTLDAIAVDCKAGL